MISESQVERLYIAKLYQDEEEKRVDEIHVTDLANPCPRAVYFEKKNPLPPSPENAMRMLEGRLLHKLQVIPESEMELEIEYQGIKGRIDEYKDGIVLEKKYVDFVPNNIAEVQKYYNHYVEQVGFYAYMLVNLGYEFKQAFLLFVKRGEQNERGRRPLKAFDVTSLIDLNKIEAEFHSRKNNIKAMLDKGKPPEISPTFSAFDYPCSYCKYVSRCYSSV
jgi:hypothetical protein